VRKMTPAWTGCSNICSRWESRVNVIYTMFHGLKTDLYIESFIKLSNGVCMVF
jgi:hypothetical protein